MIKTLKLALAAAISGLITGLTFNELGLVEYTPGFYFGVATAVVLITTYKLSLPRALFWVAASTASWNLALRVFLAFGNGSAEILQMGAAGLAGGLLLGIGFWTIVRRDSAAIIPLSAVVGGLAGVAMHFVLESELGGTSSPALAFALWQVTVILSLASDFAPRLVKPFRR
jgi:hypothetical protein